MVSTSHNLYYSEDFVLSTDDFDTTRKAGWVAEDLIKNPLPGVLLDEPRKASMKEVSQVHSEDYLAALKTGFPADLANSANIAWDKQTFSRALSTCGGMLAAGRSALKSGVSGCLASGFHHARRDQGCGYCTLNGLAVSAYTLAESCKHILIIDLDAHCGGGTHSLIMEHARLWQIDVSVNDYDRYTPSLRCQLSIVTDADRYLQTVWECLKQAEEEWPHFDLCFYNAGMDVHEVCANGGLNGLDEFIITLREEMVFQWCAERRIPVAYCLAGGYIGKRMSQRKLVDLHRLTILSASHNSWRVEN
jgi:acetoin utilization deacetylase AcuC-like enzyme